MWNIKNNAIIQLFLTRFVQWHVTDVIIILLFIIFFPVFVNQLLFIYACMRIKIEYKM